MNKLKKENKDKDEKIKQLEEQLKVLKDNELKQKNDKE